MILLFAFRKIRWSTPIDRDPRRKSGLNGCRDPPPPLRRGAPVCRRGARSRPVVFYLEVRGVVQRLPSREAGPWLRTSMVDRPTDQPNRSPHGRWW